MGMRRRLCSSEDEEEQYACYGKLTIQQTRKVQLPVAEPPPAPIIPDRERIGPHTPEGDENESLENNNNKISKKKSRATAKRRNRRNKLKALRAGEFVALTNNNNINEANTSQIKTVPIKLGGSTSSESRDERDSLVDNTEIEENINMSDNKPVRDEVLAARQAKKLAKQKGKGKEAVEVKDKPAEQKKDVPKQEVVTTSEEVKEQKQQDGKVSPLKSKDEVDKACININALVIDDDKHKEQIKAERAAKKAAKQAKKKGAGEEKVAKIEQPVVKPEIAVQPVVKPENVEQPVVKPVQKVQVVPKPVNEDMTVKDVVVTLREIVTVAKDFKDVTEKVSAIDLSGKKPAQSEKPQEVDKEQSEEGGKSKAELRAERRAKQEAQRAAKQSAAKQAQKDISKPKETAKLTPERDSPSKEDKAARQKTLEKKAKPQSSNRVNWFQHLYKEHDKESLKSLAINSQLHPAIVKLGVQLASRVVTGSNARCVGLLDALKKMVRDYTLPAKTEFARGLESHLASSLEFLWAMRAPSASQTNAVKFFRYHLTQLPNNVAEFDAKKTLQEEIDRYIREQIDMAGEAISIAVRNKISNGDNILTYGCSSLIERILLEAWAAGVQFRTVVVGNRVHRGAAEMLRRLVARGLPCTYADITSLAPIMNTINKVVLGAGALLVNGSVLGALGSAQVALAARARNVPVLVACETHKFCERVQTDAFVYNEIGDPDDLIDKSDEHSALKDWRSNQNLTPLNLTYDVTPASLVTAVVTELAILPCTSAPVVLRFKLSEYSV